MLSFSLKQSCPELRSEVSGHDGITQSWGQRSHGLVVWAVAWGTRGLRFNPFNFHLLVSRRVANFQFLFVSALQNENGAFTFAASAEAAAAAVASPAADFATGCVAAAAEVPIVADILSCSRSRDTTVLRAFSRRRFWTWQVVQVLTLLGFFISLVK